MEEKNKAPEKCNHQGKNIEFWRTFNKWTQKQLGDEIGLSQNTVSDLEKQEKVDEKTLKKIAEVLGIDIRHLLKCNHSDILDTCKNVINYFVNEGVSVANVGGENNNASSTSTLNNFPLEKVSELYERLMEAKEEITLLKAENERLKNKG
ncbi:MAG: helix-turn-helix domain-containing protein [Prevotella sp.]|jgi:transcriptional regulator with XRE-family HTH domain|nr:helix-turn-helix domain-containing protein [Prevotella sp.]